MIPGIIHLEDGFEFACFIRQKKEEDAQNQTCFLGLDLYKKIETILKDCPHVFLKMMADGPGLLVSRCPHVLVCEN